MHNIEIIYDELKRNQIHIDRHTLAIHITQFSIKIKIYSFKYVHVLDFEQLYWEIIITNFGRTIAYLTYVYICKERMKKLLAVGFETQIIQNIIGCFFWTIFT